MLYGGIYLDKIVINDNAKIYVICPAYVKTGGSELLHQLVYELNKNGFEAYITYFSINNKNHQYTDNDFKKYVNNYKIISEIEDISDNYVVAYEDTKVIKFSKKIKNAKVILWWLSVDNFLNFYGLKNALNFFSIRQVFNYIIGGKIFNDFSYIRTIDYHLCQSYYVINYLKKMGIEKICYLSDYISDEYLNIPENWENKEDIIVYNPRKGFDFTKKIINKAPELNFVPIQNLTTNQVKELLLKSKVYIDFGYHPGKDRLPRETAACGCCVITNKKGSAKFYEDVPINDEFKFDDDEENIELIIEKIKECLIDYDTEIKKFKLYRDFINQEKYRFSDDVKKIF